MPFISALNMSKMKKIAYKYCIVPCCLNSTFKTPNKLFFWVPKDAVQRNEWCKAMKRDTLSIKSTLYCCEDHFSLENDMQNYWQYKLTADVRKISLKKDVVPHIFSCQENSVAVPEKPCTVKRKSKNDVELSAEKVKCISNCVNAKKVKSKAEVLVRESKINIPPHAKEDLQTTTAATVPLSNNNSVDYCTPEIEINVKQEPDSVATGNVCPIPTFKQKDLCKFANNVDIKQEKNEEVNNTKKIKPENKTNLPCTAEQDSPTAPAVSSSYNSNVRSCAPKTAINIKQETDTVDDCAEVNHNSQNATTAKVCTVSIVEQKGSNNFANYVNVKEEKSEEKLCIPEDKNSLPRAAEQNSDIATATTATSSNKSRVGFSISENDLNMKQTTDTADDCAVVYLNCNSQNATTDKTCIKRQEDKKECWKAEIKKNNYQRGLEYSDRTGKAHKSRGVKFACKKTCQNKCTSLITHKQQAKIHEQFWNLSASEKNNFYCQFIERETTSRTRTTGENMRKRLYSYTYYLCVNDNYIKVCQDFFLNTIDVSKRRIYYFFHEVLDKEIGIVRSSLTGKNIKSYFDDKAKEAVREHIKSFSHVESHHNKTDSNKECLEAALSLAEMYKSYKSSVPWPVTESLYRHIFNTEFNMKLLRPSKEPYSISKENSRTDLKLSSKVVTSCDKPIENKNASEAQKDKEFVKNENICSVCFYLQNMFSLPKTETSLYERKLNADNSTALCSYHSNTGL